MLKGEGMKRKHIFIASVTVTLMFTAAGCKSQQVPIEKQEFIMGTIISEKVYGKNAEKAAQEVMEKFKYIEDTMTINAPGSEIDQLNAQAGKKSVQVSEDSFRVLQKAQEFAQKTQGAFDPTVGPLVKAWGIFTDAPRVPAAEEINQLRGLVNYRDLILDVKTRSAKLARQGQILDLGGIAKGYAGDVAIEIYKKHGIQSAFVNLGGNVVVLGKKPDGSLWRIGIQDPRDTQGKLIGIVKVADKAVVTAGDYQRYFEKDGKRYHHILDPETGYPSQSDLISVTIITDSSTDADGMDTGLFVLGREKAMEIVKNTKNMEAIMVTADKKVYATAGAAKIFTFEGADKGYEYVEER